MSAPTQLAEARETFACFGSTCSVLISGHGPAGGAEEATSLARRRLEEWHGEFSRFEPESELSRLNRDQRCTVAVSQMMARFAETVGAVGALTGGLVDATLLTEIERAGYTADLELSPVSLAEALSAAPPRRRGGPGASSGWRQVHVDRAAGTVTRPPGLLLDSGRSSEPLPTTLSHLGSILVP